MHLFKENNESYESDAEWIEVFTTTDDIEAEIIKALLESGRIRVKIKSLKVTPYPVNVGKMGEIHILVRKIDEDMAREVINRENSGRKTFRGDT